jgi:hypothetical protein
MSAVAAYDLYKRDGDAELERIGKDEKVLAEIAYFKRAIAEVDSVEEFLDDQRLVDFALTSFGLHSERAKTGLLRRVFSESLDDPRAAVNQLPDKSFFAMAEKFGFGDFGAFKIHLQSFTGELADRYVKGIQRQRIEERNPAVSAALFLKDQALSDKGIESAFQVLASPTLRELFSVAFNIPDAIAYQEVGTQARYVERAVDLEKLQDPFELEKLVRRFLVTVDFNANPVADTGGVLNLFT